MKYATKKFAQKIALAAAASAIFSTSAMASIVGPATPGGSAAILSLVDNVTSDSISIDLGKTMSQLVLGDSFALSAAAQQFIVDAGGLGAISYGVIAGDTSNFNTNVYLTSSANDLTTKQVANATKGTWGNSIIQLTGNLNAGDATPTTDNLTYGPYAVEIGSPNYIAGGHFNWQTGDADLNNLALGTDTMALYQYTLSGFAGFTGAEQLFSQIELTEGSLNIVPIPAAVWLFGSALMGLFGAGRREQIAAYVRGALA